MSDKFKAEIISPDKSILKTDTNEVVLPSYEGEIGILKDHAPLITFLRPGKIFFKDIQKNFYVEDGTVEFSNNNLLILTSTAKDLSEVDRKFLEISLSKNKKKITNSDITDKERYILSYKIETLKNINL